MSAITVGPSGSMLPQVWNLTAGGQLARNVEGLCRGVLNAKIRNAGMRLEPCDYDESLAFLLGEAAIQADIFDPSRGCDLELEPWLYTRLTLRLIDHWRSFYGRNGAKRVPSQAALTAARRDAGADADDEWRIDPADPHDDPADG